MPREYNRPAFASPAPGGSGRRVGRPIAAAVLLLALLAGGTVVGAGEAIDRAEAEGTSPPAEADYRQRIAAEPLEPEHYLGLARLLIEQGTSQRALSLLGETAIDWMRLGRYREAATLLELAVEIAPQSSRTWSLLGRAHALARSYRAAEEPLRRAVELGDRSTMTLVMLGSTLWENGSLAAADEVLVEASEAPDDDSVVALHQLGKLRLWQGRSGDATEALAEVVSKRPGWVEPRLDLARALQAVGRAEEARRQFETYLEQVPDDPEARYGLALTLRSLGEDARAAEQMRRSAELRERDRQATLTEGRFEAARDEALYLLLEGRYAAARQLLESLPRTADVSSLLSRVYAAEGDRAAAIRALEEALARDPGRADLRARLQALYLEGGDGS